MYTSFQLAKKYLHYYFTASNGKGHGVHSPFVFDFIKFVLNDDKKYAGYDEIESLRKKMLHDHSIINVEDFGAGSTVIKTNQRVVSKIAASSLKPKKYSRLLHRITRYYKPTTILELGTSFGITTAYLAKGNEAAAVHTLEGAPSIATIAQKNFDELFLKNIKLIRGDFELTLPYVLHELKEINLAFIDGNHRKEPTLKYFHHLLQYASASSILIFDDIHWSKEMEEAWQQIKEDNAVTLTIDLFFIGLVFINPDFKVKQHFTIRF